MAQGYSQRLVRGRSLVWFPRSAWRTEPQNCSWCGSHHHQCMNYCKFLWTQASSKCPECKDILTVFMFAVYMLTHAAFCFETLLIIVIIKKSDQRKQSSWSYRAFFVSPRLYRFLREFLFLWLLQFVFFVSFKANLPHHNTFERHKLPLSTQQRDRLFRIFYVSTLTLSFASKCFMLFECKEVYVTVITSFFVSVCLTKNTC